MSEMACPTRVFSKALTSVMLAGLVRPLMTVYLTYQTSKDPISLSSGMASSRG